jgi:hypothetical protein
MIQNSKETQEVILKSAREHKVVDPLFEIYSNW